MSETEQAPAADLLMLCSDHPLAPLGLREGGGSETVERRYVSLLFNTCRDVLANEVVFPLSRGASDLSQICFLLAEAQKDQ